MNYIKYFDLRETVLEPEVNEWLKAIHEQGHRVLNSKIHYYTKAGIPMVKAVFTVNAEPHPHR